MPTKLHRFTHNIVQLTTAGMVIAIIWFVYTDYVHTTSAESLHSPKGPHEVSGVVELVPTSKGIVVFPANQHDENQAPPQKQ